MPHFDIGMHVLCYESICCHCHTLSKGQSTTYKLGIMLLQAVCHAHVLDADLFLHSITDVSYL